MAEVTTQTHSPSSQPNAVAVVPTALATVPPVVNEESEIAARLQMREQTDVVAVKQAIAKALGIDVAELEQRHAVEYQQNIGRDDLVLLDVTELKAQLGEHEFLQRSDAIAAAVKEALPGCRGIQRTENLDGSSTLGFPLATLEGAMQTLDRSALENLSNGALIKHMARHYNNAAGIRDSATREAAFSQVNEAIGILSERQLSAYDQYLVDGYAIATNARSGALPANSDLQTLQRFAGSQYATATPAEFPVDAAETINLAKQYTKNIRSEADLERVQRYAAGYQPSAMIEKIFKAEELAGVSPEKIAAAQAELGTIVHEISDEIKLDNLSEPREIMAHIHKYLAETYQWKYGTETSLVNGLVSHNLDCDTVTAIYCEVGKQLDYPIRMELIRGEPYSHAVAKWESPKDKESFYWDSITANTAGAEKSKREIRDSMRNGGTEPSRKFETLTDDDVVTLLALQKNNVNTLVTQVLAQGANIDSLDSAAVETLRNQAAQILKVPSLADDPATGLLQKVLNQTATAADLEAMRALAVKDENLQRFATIVEAIAAQR